MGSLLPIGINTKNRPIYGPLIAIFLNCKAPVFRSRKFTSLDCPLSIFPYFTCFLDKFLLKAYFFDIFH